jgi:hypothetical protein
MPTNKQIYIGVGVLVALIVLVLVILYATGYIGSSSSSSSSSNSNTSPTGSGCPTVPCSTGQTCNASGQCVTNLPICGGGNCTSTQTCQQGTCVDNSTICTDPCVSPQTCVNNKCVDPPACTTGSCPHNQTCTNNVCVCNGDGQCGSGEWCNSGTCIVDTCLAMGTNPNGLACYHGSYQNCTATIPCPTGTSCDTENGGYCIPSTCNKTSDCLNTTIYECNLNVKGGQCQVTSCQNSTGCGPGQYCNNDKCTNIVPCEQDGSCASTTSTCWSGMCLPSCDYTSSTPCTDSTTTCIPAADPWTKFDVVSPYGVCVTKDTVNPHSVFNGPQNIQCSSTGDCPLGWYACNIATGATVGVCEQYNTTSCVDGGPNPNMAPNYYCDSGTLTKNVFSNCMSWQPIDVSTNAECPGEPVYGSTTPVPNLCLGNTTLTPSQMGIKISSTTDGNTYNMVPVVFRLSGSGAPGYPLFGFYNSNGKGIVGFSTFDLGDWHTFDSTGPRNQTALNSIYKNCHVSSAAYLYKNPACTDTTKAHIPAWTDNMNGELPLTYDGVPFCYNTPGGSSIADVSGTSNAPSTYTGYRSTSTNAANYCIQPSNQWGPSAGPESGSLDPMVVYMSDGANSA